MAETMFTPGPWSLCAEEPRPASGDIEIIAPRDDARHPCWWVANVFGDMPANQSEANARLISAAPDLDAVATNMVVSGPDGDGLLWIMFSGTDGGPKGALSVRFNSIAGRALSSWRDARDAALAKARGETNA